MIHVGHDTTGKARAKEEEGNRLETSQVLP